jgi:Response regulator containing a CheY-like receiver domain and an HTH DNA-binding domain
MLRSEDTLSGQLTWERLARQIITRLHGSLDRDVVLQALVDSIARSLNCQRCLVIKAGPTSNPVVTHEFAEADISPLGLGRTTRFPESMFSFFQKGLVAIADITALREHENIQPEDINELLESGISSMVGAPLIRKDASGHGSSFEAHDVVVVQELGRLRNWHESEIDLIQVALTHAAISLEHCLAHKRLQDQLLNLNLLGNLTQQLTTTLELASGSTRRPAEADGKLQPREKPPLSSRELEVLRLIASGLANKEIANQLFLTESTVELHASRIRKKLKLRSRTALVKFACDNDLV